VAQVKLSGVKKSFGSFDVLTAIDLDVRSGEFVVFVGPSGCGKSTLLRIIAGLEEITGGRLEIDGVVANQLTPKERGIAMVFQSYALYPHMTVFENMSFGLSLGRSTPKAEIERRVREAATLLQLEPYLDRLPKALSGGQRQRVAIGRAITRDPKVFLFDEPLSNLDAALRVQTRIEIANLHERMPNTTMIYVTHDQVEAMTLADRIVVLNKGRIEQIGTPLELYGAPDNLFVARFIGSPAMNIVPGVVRRNGGSASVALAGGGRAPIEFPASAAADGQDVHLGVRPEHLRIVEPDQAILTGTVIMTESLGEVTLLYLTLAEGGEPIVVKLPGAVAVEHRKTISVGADPDALHLFGDNGLALRNSLAASRA
jgi:alpha-glucoside transport system ATP-binding protein